MEFGSGCSIKIILLFSVLSGYLLVSVHSRKLTLFKPLKLLHTLKKLGGHFPFLRQCRRQLTFIGSTALGSFITRVIKESPLTPLPMPQVDDPARWNFLTVSLRFSVPYAKWMEGFAGNPQQFFKKFDDLPSSFRDADNSIDVTGQRNHARFRRNLFRTIKISPHLIAKVISKALKSLHSTISTDKGTIQWLTRWCR